MIINVLDYLESISQNCPHKTAVVEPDEKISFSELSLRSQKIGSGLIPLIRNMPVPVFMEKGIDTLCAFFGIVYAGGCYALLNPDLPGNRLKNIITVLNAEILLTDQGHYDQAAALFPQCKILLIEALLDTPIDTKGLNTVRQHHIDTDPLYINFTSGSTGIPKGIVVSHRSVIDFIEQFTKLFHITQEDVIANQAPFDFDVSVKDIYSTIKNGATLVIVPKDYFSAPVRLLDYLCDHQITTMIWAVSALCLISAFHGLDYKTPHTVRKILFSGEVMPTKHLKNWRTHLPDCLFVNLYGPTEITCNCTYHILNADKDYDNGIPMGKPFPNEDVFLLDDQNRLITEPNQTGEICVRGTALALGYYGRKEDLQNGFVSNPLNQQYNERIYRTGDLGNYGEDGNLFFCGRKDFQIKYMGHRIELEEIEKAMAQMDGVERCCCIFNPKKEKLHGFYMGETDDKTLHTALAKVLPVFMIPGKLHHLESLPLTKNGKIDRKALFVLTEARRHGKS